MAKIIEWTEALSVKVKIIDEQHQRIIRITNDLYQAMMDKVIQEKFDEILKELIDYYHVHFSNEEGYMKKFAYQDIESHQKEHREFIAKIDELNQKRKDQKIESSFELIDFLEDWILNHIAVIDQKYVKCFHEHGLP